LHFKSAGQTRRFLSAHDQINNLFKIRRDHATAINSGVPRLPAADGTGIRCQRVCVAKRDRHIHSDRDEMRKFSRRLRRGPVAYFERDGRRNAVFGTDLQRLGSPRSR